MRARGRPVLALPHNRILALRQMSPLRLIPLPLIHSVNLL
jgi:hypothetical protein